MKKLSLLLLPLLFLGCLTTTQEQPLIEENLNADAVLDNQIFYAATKLNDLDKCQKIISQDKLKECISVVNANLATENAVKTLSKSPCRTITMKRYADNCESSVNEAVAAKEASENEQSYINDQSELTQSIIESGDLKKCDSIQDENFKSDCVTNITFKQAVETNNSKVCETLDDESLVKLCKTQF